jgi:hypothetical protein
MSARRPLILALLASAAALAAGGTADGRAGIRGRAAPAVLSMIVGSHGEVLAPARVVTAGAGSVRVAGRSCAVAAGTPLAVLVARRHAGGPAFTLRDYGRCGASPASSAALFVNSLAGQVNRGQDGWVYKVGGLIGSTGAADPSGPQGDGRRLRSGARVVWFWCHSAAGGCQRTLELNAPATVARGGAVSVRVLGRDNEGRAVPVAGAIVRLGSGFASTAADGRAMLVAPTGAGRFQLTAERAGLVPSFPVPLAVE